MDFGKVFRTSALNHLVKDQVIARSKSNSFHLKHEILTNPKTVIVQDLDNKDLKKSFYKSAWEQTDMQKRWFELFGPGIMRNATQPYIKPAMLSEPKNTLPMKKLDEMSKEEWKIWVKHAYEKRAEFQELLKLKKINILGVNSFLGLDKLPVEEGRHPMFYSKPAEIAENRRNFQPVTGRIWSRLSSEIFIVLIAGFPAILHLSDIPDHYSHLKRRNYQINQSDEYAFTVIEAIYRDGRPSIKVSLNIQTRKLMDGLESLKSKDATNISAIPRPEKSLFFKNIFGDK